MAARLCGLGLLLLLVSQAAFSQSFQEDCTGATLDGLSFLPINDTMLSGGDADFTVQPSCQLGSTAFSDIVTCFTPQNTCTVEFICNAAGGSNVRSSIHSGSCATNFSNCLVAGADVVPGTPSPVSLALSAGSEYCFVCQNTVGNGNFSASITTAGDCGALPVEVSSFQID